MTTGELSDSVHYIQNLALDYGSYTAIEKEGRQTIKYRKKHYINQQRYKIPATLFIIKELRDDMSVEHVKPNEHKRREIKVTKNLLCERLTRRAKMKIQKRLTAICRL